MAGKNEGKTTENETAESSKDVATVEPTPENNDGLQSNKSPFSIMDEVQTGGDYTISSIAEEVEESVAEEQGDNDPETGLKADGEGEEKETPDNETEEDSATSEETEEDATENEEGEEEESNEEEESETVSEQPEWLTTRLKETDPDLDLEDTEAVQQAVDDLFESKTQVEQVRKDLQSEREANKAFYDLLEGSDSMRQVAKFMYKHDVDMPEALTALGIEAEIDMDKLKKEDPDKYLEIKKEREERAKQAEKQEKLTKEQRKKFKENESTSFENVEAVSKELELDSKAQDELIDELNTEVQNISESLITQDLIKTFYKGRNYDQDIAKAREEGIIEGKNKKIEELSKKKKGDGMPDLSSSSPRKAEKEKGDIFSEALQEAPTRISEID